MEGTRFSGEDAVYARSILTELANAMTNARHPCYWSKETHVSLDLITSSLPTPNSEEPLHPCLIPSDLWMKFLVWKRLNPVPFLKKSPFLSGNLRKSA